MKRDEYERRKEEIIQDIMKKWEALPPLDRGKLGGKKMQMRYKLNAEASERLTKLNREYRETKED